MTALPAYKTYRERDEEVRRSSDKKNFYMTRYLEAIDPEEPKKLSSSIRVTILVVLLFASAGVLYLSGL